MFFCLCQLARTFGVDNAIRRQEEHICPISNGASCGLGEGSFPCDETQNSKIVDKISGINALAGEINAAKSLMSGHTSETAIQVWATIPFFLQGSHESRGRQPPR